MDKQWRDGNNCLKPSVRELLEERAKQNQPMLDFKLANSNLEGVKLVNYGSKSGYKLLDADLYHANFRSAHCFMLDFSGSSLMKADFSNANMHCANLENCNLLGTKFDGAKLENINWGEKVIQERMADKCESLDERLDLYEQAEEIYRNLRKIFENEGLFETAGFFFEREMISRRMQMPRWSVRRVLSKLVDIVCGYGERPLRIIIFSNMVILLFSCLYFLAGLSFSGEQLGFDAQLPLLENTMAFLNSIYFSVVTFTTLGYGDIAPQGLSRLFTAIEALMGSFTMALFVVVFVKKMTR